LPEEIHWGTPNRRPKRAFASSALWQQASSSLQNLGTSSPLGILIPSSPWSSNLATVLPVCAPLVASSVVPSVTTVTPYRSRRLRSGERRGSKSKNGIACWPVATSAAATAIGSCRGGPAVIPKTSLSMGREIRHEAVGEMDDVMPSGSRGEHSPVCLCEE
jgi:hypothetical protein